MKRLVSIKGALEGDAGGAGDAQSWDLVLFLRPWRRDGDTNIEVNAQLRVEMPVGKRGVLSRHMKRLENGALISFETDDLQPPGELPWWVARVQSYRRLRVDPPLQAARAELDKPVVIEDQELGTLTLERRFDWYSGKRRFAGRSYELSISRSSNGADDARADRRVIARARKTIMRCEARMETLHDAIVREMLPLYNDNWKGERPRLTAERFSARIKLASVDVRPGRHTTLYFNNGDLFSDHLIELRLNANGRVVMIDLA